VDEGPIVEETTGGTVTPEVHWEGDPGERGYATELP